jgi:hypothetical protein
MCASTSLDEAKPIGNLIYDKRGMRAALTLDGKVYSAAHSDAEIFHEHSAHGPCRPSSTRRSGLPPVLQLNATLEALENSNQ